MVEVIEIERPFICCPVCAQRIPLRIDAHPTFHYLPADAFGRMAACDYSWPRGFTR